MGRDCKESAGCRADDGQEASRGERNPGSHLPSPEVAGDAHSGQAAAAASLTGEVPTSACKAVLGTRPSLSSWFQVRVTVRSKVT